MRYHDKVIKNKGGTLIMEEDNMKNLVLSDSRNIKFDKEDDDECNKIKKVADAPEWNEDLQKIVVGYH